MSFDKIPDELKALRQWICWELVDRDGKKTKLPINAKTGKLASTTDAATWTDFDAAVMASTGFSGIGFVFTDKDPYCGIDMDGHIDDELIEWIGSYTELSQSGNGAHIICRAKLPETGRRSGNLEIYDGGRYFVMTGNVIRQKHAIEDAQDQIDTFMAHVFGKAEEKNPVRSSVPSGDVIERIRSSNQSDKFNRLWLGDISGHGSASEADAALLSILRFWTGGDKSAAFALFAQSGLVRPKWQRADYRERTWSAIDSGDVWTDMAEVVLSEMDSEAKTLPRSVVSTSLSPWRKVSTKDVEAAISGTMLEAMVEVLRSPTNPPLPFEIGLAKALPVFGAFLCGEAKPDPGRLAIHQLSRGIDRARVKIDTAGGQACNVWSILVAPSSSGKDIGGLADELLKKHELFLGTAGSEEGIADALAEKGNGVMMISEMANWLDKRHWQSKAAGFLTYAWNKGFFVHAMSRRSKDAPEARAADYCYPSIAASIQPEILKTLASRADMDSGFLGRFLMIQHEDCAWFPFPCKLDKRGAMATLDSMADTLMAVNGTIRPAEEKYQAELANMFISHDAGIRPVVNRLCNEYLLRIALFLMIDGREDRLPSVFSQDAIERAGIVCQWLYGHAERLCGNLTESRETNEREAKMDRIVRLVETRGAAGTKWSDISQCRSTRSIQSKERQEMLSELVDRGRIVATKSDKTSGPKTVVYLPAEAK
jgi:hypothetical protein